MAAVAAVAGTCGVPARAIGAYAVPGLPEPLAVFAVFAFGR
jgi:hypothetical protein